MIVYCYRQLTGRGSERNLKCQSFLLAGATTHGSLGFTGNHYMQLFIWNTYLCHTFLLLYILLGGGSCCGTPVELYVHDCMQVESPVSLLSQDMSREYLHQQDAKKKYEVKYVRMYIDVCT